MFFNADSEGLILAKANQLSMTVGKEQRKLASMKSTLKSKHEEFASLNNNFSQVRQFEENLV